MVCLKRVRVEFRSIQPLLCELPGLHAATGWKEVQALVPSLVFCLSWVFWGVIFNGNFFRRLSVCIESTNSAWSSVWEQFSIILKPCATDAVSSSSILSRFFVSGVLAGCASLERCGWRARQQAGQNFFSPFMFFVSYIIPSKIRIGWVLWKHWSILWEEGGPTRDACIQASTRSHWQATDSVCLSPFAYFDESFGSIGALYKRKMNWWGMHPCKQTWGAIAGLYP